MRLGTRVKRGGFDSFHRSKILYWNSQDGWAHSIPSLNTLLGHGKALNRGKRVWFALASTEMVSGGLRWRVTTEVPSSFNYYGSVAELVYALDSKSSGGNPVWVRVPPELRLRKISWCGVVVSTAFQNKVFWQGYGQQFHEIRIPSRRLRFDSLHRLKIWGIV